MKTDDFAAMLATGAGAVESRTTSRRYAAALGWGAFGATLLMAIALGVRPDLESAALRPMFWVKLAFPAALAAASLVAATRLSRPGVRLRRVSAALAAPMIAMALLAAFALWSAPPGERSALLMGSTWRYCLFSIPLLSVPVLVTVLWAMKGLAPTRPALAGGAAGLLAGTLAATVYALHCPEMDAPFLVLWYTVGMLIPAMAAALLGPLVLRW